ncbi:hypothetical protein [Tsukamurella tyrosinosolvens]|uniref:hypothetical protein n=1 Tax=Tsukamurella tyrosinosolvens TaxID=57704 RepID=UPI002DD424B7|nr:hypothetical protein [Tsukamurella tyrosinosolvens]MEC4614614.1 hypothetical protein [Tsukamurella tyrosinosolvens]
MSITIERAKRGDWCLNTGRAHLFLRERELDEIVDLIAALRDPVAYTTRSDT